MLYWLLARFPEQIQISEIPLYLTYKFRYCWIPRSLYWQITPTGIGFSRYSTYGFPILSLCSEHSYLRISLNSSLYKKRQFNGLLCFRWFFSNAKSKSTRPESLSFFGEGVSSVFGDSVSFGCHIFFGYSFDFPKYRAIIKKETQKRKKRYIRIDRK